MLKVNIKLAIFVFMPREPESASSLRLGVPSYWHVNKLPVIVIKYPVFIYLRANLTSAWRISDYSVQGVIQSGYTEAQTKMGMKTTGGTKPTSPISPYTTEAKQIFNYNYRDRDEQLGLLIRAESERTRRHDALDS